MKTLDNYNLPERLVSRLLKPIEYPSFALASINQVQKQFLFHDRGNYWWCEVSAKHDLIEEVIIMWLPGSDSGVHDHSHSWSLTHLLSNNSSNSVLNTYLYEKSDGQQIICEQQLDFKQYHLVPPYQKHRVSNQGTETIIGRHLYYPRRN
jgi:hypothetical protein